MSFSKNPAGSTVDYEALKLRTLGTPPEAPRAMIAPEQPKKNTNGTIYRAEHSHGDWYGLTGSQEAEGAPAVSIWYRFLQREWVHSPSH